MSPTDYGSLPQFNMRALSRKTDFPYSRIDIRRTWSPRFGARCGLGSIGLCIVGVHQCPAKNAPRSQPKAYGKIMNSFSGLASDLVKIPDMCEFGLGLIQSAKHIIHKTPCSERQSSMLALTDNARSVTASVVDGITTAKLTSIIIEKELTREMTHELNNKKLGSFRRNKVISHFLVRCQKVV